VVIIGFRISNKPPDPEHPFGHAKAEYIATLVVALLMVMAGFQIGQDSLLGLIRGTRSGVQYPLTLPLFVVLVGLMTAKELLGSFSRALGRMISSQALMADAWHHRTDALSTAIVIVGLGGRNLGWPWLDGVAGFLVSLYIAYTGLKLAYDTFSPLLGEMAPPEDIEAIRRIASQVPDVVNTHDIKVHKYGHFYFTTIHAELSDRMNVHAMHEVTVGIETRILKRFPGECVVHMDPVNLHHPLHARVSDALTRVVVGHPALVEFHDLNLWKETTGEQGDVEISVDPHTPEEQYQALSRHVEQELMRRFPDLHLRVRLKVDFTAEPLEV
jgi:cation diffusion facilitator family transporter